MPGTLTTVEVRVIAFGGKFLGDDIGGAEVTLRDVLTGALLAHGRIRGGSGNAQEIMETPRTWGTAIPTDQASVFTAALDLSEPRLVEFAAYGPLGSLQSAKRVTDTLWVVPGVDLAGADGVVLVIPGLLVEVLSPATHDSTAPGPVAIEANVAMMCGCPITPVASPPASPPALEPWPAPEFTVSAYVYLLSEDGSRLLATVPLACTATSRFTGSWTMTSPGFYEVVVVARQAASPNTGVDRATFFAPPPS